MFNAVKFLIAIIPGNSFSLNENSFGVTIFVDLVLGVLPFQVNVTLINQEGGTAIGMHHNAWLYIYIYILVYICTQWNV